MLQKPLWKVIRPPDWDADFGENSRYFMEVSLWLEKRHPQIMVRDEAPVNWSAVYAVLVELMAETGNPAEVPLQAVVERLGQYLGVLVPV